MTNPSQNTLPEFGISQPEAICRIIRWQECEHDFTINAFTFPHLEFKELMCLIDKYNEQHGSTPVDALRFYLGTKQDDEGNNIPCLMVVAVTAFHQVSHGVVTGGNDIVCLEHDGVTPNIYDFSYPCPDTCANTGHSIMDVPNLSEISEDCACGESKQ